MIKNKQLCAILVKFLIRKRNEEKMEASQSPSKCILKIYIFYVI